MKSKLTATMAIALSCTVLALDLAAAPKSGADPLKLRLGVLELVAQEGFPDPSPG